MNNLTTTKLANANVICNVLSENGFEYLINADGTISTEIPITLIYVPETRLRKVDEAKIPNLEQALRDQGQLHPLSVSYDLDKKRFALWEGGHRLVAMDRIKPDYIAKVTIGQYNLFTSIFGNTARVAQKTGEVVQAIVYLAGAGYNFDEIAKRLNLDSNFVEKHFKLGILPESVRADLDNETINLAQAFEIAKAMHLPEKDKLSEDQLNALIVNARGLAVNPETGAAKSKATAQELKNMVSRFKSLNTMERKKALGITGKEKKVFTFQECFSNTRLEEFKIKFDKVFEDKDLDGEDLTEGEQAVKEFLDYIFMRTEEDKQQARERFLEKNPDGVLDKESL